MFIPVKVGHLDTAVLVVLPEHTLMFVSELVFQVPARDAERKFVIFQTAEEVLNGAIVADQLKLVQNLQPTAQSVDETLVILLEDISLSFVQSVDHLRKEKETQTGQEQRGVIFLVEVFSLELVKSVAQNLLTNSLPRKETCVQIVMQKPVFQS
jgi:hypothetical protein